MLLAPGDQTKGTYANGLTEEQLNEKMDNEISNIRTKRDGPEGAIQYALRVTKSGEYVCYRCESGSIMLNIGDVWKYGETTNPASRYSREVLSVNNLIFVPEFVGTQKEVKEAEKIKIYNYYKEHNRLPPGNRIFR